MFSFLGSVSLFFASNQTKVSKVQFISLWRWYKSKLLNFLNYNEECLTKLITVHLPFTFWWINGGSFLSYLWSQVILSTFMYESALNFFFENEREIRLGKGLKVKNQFFILLISPKWRACLRMMKRWKKRFQVILSRYKLVLSVFSFILSNCLFSLTDINWFLVIVSKI